MLGVGACGGGSDTTTLESSTTSGAKSSTSLKPSTDSFEGLVETLTKMGIPRDQAECVVEKMDEASAQIGDQITDQDRTLIEQLLKDCKITD
ncbi:MAG: hypothetical protein R2735_15440 [Microthrixaceae bacterium]